MPEESTLPEPTGGLIVTAVRKDGPAMNAGTQVGDIIRLINNRPANLETLARITPGSRVELNVNRGGEDVPLSLIPQDARMNWRGLASFFVPGRGVIAT